MELGTAIAGIVGGLVAGAIQKHAISRLPNDAIPFLNGIIVGGTTLALTRDPILAGQAGISAAAGGTGAHQLLKIGVRQAVNKGLKALMPRRLYSAKLEPWIGRLNEKVGPGLEISI